MKQAKLLFFLIAALAFASCCSDEPRYADPEAHDSLISLSIFVCYTNFLCELFGSIVKKDYLCSKLLSSAILS